MSISSPGDCRPKATIQRPLKGKAAFGPPYFVGLDFWRSGPGVAANDGLRYPISSYALRPSDHCSSSHVCLRPESGEAEEVPNSGASLYETRCASCHRDLTGANDRIPSEDQLRERSPEQVEAALKTGAMTAQAAGLSDEEIHLLATFVTGKAFGGPAAESAGACPGNPPPFNPNLDTAWNGWSIDNQNTRFQPNPGLTRLRRPEPGTQVGLRVPGCDARSLAGDPRRRAGVRRQPRRQFLFAGCQDGLQLLGLCGGRHRANGKHRGAGSERALAGLLRRQLRAICTRWT